MYESFIETINQSLETKSCPTNKNDCKVELETSVIEPTKGVYKS